MGLIKAAFGSINSTLADQWKEFFYCDAIPADTLVVKGQKRVSRHSSNKHGDENIISSGSGISVNEGQCMIIVDQGKVVELSSEPGLYTWDASTEPSIFSEGLWKGLGDMFKTMWKRFGFGGDTGHDQRIYYFNIKEIIDNKFGTMNPVPFRVVDSKIGLDIDVSIRACGTFSYKISNPLTFYQNVCGNVTASYPRGTIDGQLKSEFIAALQPGFGALSAMEIRPNAVMAHMDLLEEGMNKALAEKWFEKRGLEVVSIALTSITLPEEDQKLIKEAQRTALLRDPGMAGATLVQAQAAAMEKAAGNSSGAMNGFIGMGMAMNAGGGMNAQNLYAMNAQNQQAQQQAAAKSEAKPAEGQWKCPACGTMATGKFCPECGAKKPEEEGWKCPTCGTVNKGKFCAECGGKRPAGAPIYRCDKCGWEPEDPHNPPKFCPNCGDPFDDKDIK